MRTIDSGSIEETSRRLGVLYNNHHDWLLAVAYNQSKDLNISKDLVQELYLYLGEKQNPKLYFNDSFNLLYCYNFISSRFINFIKRENRSVYVSHWKDVKDDAYNIDEDKKLETAYEQIKKELDNLKTTKMWSSARLYELYAFSDITMEELSKKIGISKSTTFLNIKKIKEYLKTKIDNPFDKNIEDE